MGLTSGMSRKVRMIMRMHVETYRVIKRGKVAIGNFKHNTFSVIQPKNRVEFSPEGL